MENPVKILEIKGKDWLESLSIQPDFALGGLFADATNFDSFKTMGYFQPSLSPVQIDGTTITTLVSYLTSASGGGNGYVFAIGDRSGTGAKCFYRIKMSDSTVTDYSSSIDGHAATGATQHSGITFHKSRILYGSYDSSAIRSVGYTGVGDVEVVNGLSFHPYVPLAFGLGNDGVMYFTNAGSASIGKIVSTTSTSGNTATAFSFTDTSLVPKDITNDGIYTIFIADNNGASGFQNNDYSKTTCRIFFWDTIKTKADIIYDIPDKYLISARYVDGRVLVLGASGLWVCNSATPPKLIFPLASIKLPSNASQVTVNNNIMYWASTATGAKVYAYGSKIGSPIVFSPYQSTTSTNLHTAITSSGDYFVTSVTAGGDVPKVFLHNSGSTYAQAVVSSATRQLVQPYRNHATKITLKSPLSSGQTVALSLYNGNGDRIGNAEAKSFSTYGAKKTLLFTPQSTTGSVTQFEDIYAEITSTGGAVVQRLAVYGVPINDLTQNF